MWMNIVNIRLTDSLYITNRASTQNDAMRFFRSLKEESCDVTHRVKRTVRAAEIQMWNGIRSRQEFKEILQERQANNSGVSFT